MLAYHILLATLTFCAVKVYAEKEGAMVAVVQLTGNAGVKGNVTFTQNACGENVYIRIYATGLTPGKHGFHVHEKGDLSNGCMSTGGHFNPGKVNHGAPDDDVRHVGDLGNIVADSNGDVDTTITDKLLSLYGTNSIIGRGVVVHEKDDDLGKGQHPDSKKTGNAGGRVACGVVGLKRAPYNGICPCNSIKPSYLNSYQNYIPGLEDWPVCKDGATALSLSLLAFVIAFCLSRFV